MQRHLIFLDFDGVLNSQRSCTAFPHIGYEPAGLEETAVCLVKRLCQMTGAEVVISSTWRLIYPIEDLKVFLQRKGWENPPIIDRTPGYRKNSYDIYSTGYETSSGFRGEEVAKFLEEFVKKGNELGNYVCLDDSGDFYVGEKSQPRPYRSNQPLIQTSELNGFSFENFVAALATLCPNHPDLPVFKKHIEWEYEYRQKTGSTGPFSPQG